MFLVLFDCGACGEMVSGWRRSGRTSGGGAEGADASALGAGEDREGRSPTTVAPLFVGAPLSFWGVCVESLVE